MSESIFGYYDDAAQESPTYDPGMNALCPFCLKKIMQPVRPISLMKAGSLRSYFYRSHKYCYNEATQEDITNIESSLIDSETNKENPSV